MTGMGNGFAFGFGHVSASSRCVHPSFVVSFARFETKGRREGRAPAGTRDPCAVEMHTGWTTGVAGRPAFPARMVLTVSFVLSPGSDALLPPSSCGWLMRAPGRAATSPQGLTHRPRASGPHDFSVRGRACLIARGSRVLTPGHRRTRCDHHTVSCRVARGLTVARPVTTQTAPALPRPPQPGPHLVTIAKRPFGRAGMRRLCHKSEIRESRIFLRGGVDGRIGVLPDGSRLWPARASQWRREWGLLTPIWGTA